MPINEELVTLLLVLAFAIKVVVDLAKQWMQPLQMPENFHRYTSLAISLGLGVLLAYETDAGVLQALGVQVKDFWVDTILTGLVLAGGSDLIYELISLVRNKRLDNQ